MINAIIGDLSAWLSAYNQRINFQRRYNADNYADFTLKFTSINDRRSP